MDKLARARELGVLKDGWRFVDYCLDAAPKFGWLCAVIWGEKGAGKSSTMLQHGYTIFHGFDEFETIGKDASGAPIKRGLVTDWNDSEAWRKTLEQTVFRPSDFIRMLNKIMKEKKRISWIGWDDINIHFPRSMYSTNRMLWENFSKNWEGFRANLSIFECTVPRKDKVVSFILGDMNWDILVSNRQKVEVHRWFWDDDFYDPERVNKFRIDVEDQPLNMRNTPSSVWNEYWKRKVTLIDESTQNFIEMLDQMERPQQERVRGMQCPVCQMMLGNNLHNYKYHIERRHPDYAPPPEQE
jgi:hypothetical protein